METAITIDEDFTLDVIEDTEGLEGESETLRGQDENLNISSLLRDLPIPVTSKTKEDLTESIIISDSDDEEKKAEIQIPPESLTFECSIISSKEFMKMVGKLPKVTPPKCNLCAFTTDRGLRVLQVHYLNEHKLSCHLCDFWTINMEQMIDHWTVIHKLKTFKCVTCGAIYHVEEDIIQHLKLTHNLEATIQKNFACKLCSFVTNKAEDVVNHLKLTHRKFAVIKQLKSKPTPPPKPQPKTYQQRRGGNPKTPSKPRRTFKESNAEPVRRRSTRQVVRRLEPSVYVQEQVKQRSKPKQAKKQKQTTQDEDEDVDVFTIEKSVKQKNGTMSYQVKKIIFKPTEPYSPPIFDAIKFRKVQDIMKSVVMNSNLPEGDVPVQLIEKAVPEPKTVASATSFEAFYNQNFQVDDDDDDNDDDDDGEKGAGRQPEVGQAEESIEELILKEIEAEKVSNAKNIFTRLPQTEALLDKYFDKQPIEKNVLTSEEALTSSNVTETDFAGGLSNRSQNPILNKLLSKKSGERCCLKNYSESATFTTISAKVVTSHLQKDASEISPSAQTQLIHKGEVPEETKSRQAGEGSLQTIQETSFKVPERLILKDSQSDEEPNPSKLVEADGTRVPVADSQLDLQERQKQCSSLKPIPNSKDVKESSGCAGISEATASLIHQDSEDLHADTSKCLEAEMPEELVSSNPQEESFDGDLQEANIDETQARLVQDFAEEAIREAQQDSQPKEDCQEAEVLENKVPNSKESEQKMEMSSTCTKSLQSQESEECTEESSVCAKISDVEATAEESGSEKQSHLEQFEPSEGLEVLEDRVVQAQIPNSKDLELNVQAPTTCQKILQSQSSPVEGLEGQPTLESEEVCLESISSLEILQTEIECLGRKLTEEKVCCSEDSMIVQPDPTEMSEMLGQDRQKSEDFVEESIEETPQRLKERDNSSKTPQTEAPLLDDDKEQSENSLENFNSTSDTFQIADSLDKELMDEKDIQPNNNKEITTDSAKISQAEAPVVVRLDAEERTLEDASVEGPEERLDPEGSINKLLVQGLCKKDEETMQNEEGNSDQAKDDCLESHGENHPTEADDTERQPTEEDMLQNANEAGSGDIHLQDVSSKEQPDKPKKLTSHKRPSTIINSDEGPSSKIHKTLNFELELKKNNKEDLIKELEQDLLLNISQLPTFQSKSDHSSEKPDFEWDKDFENFLSEFPPIDEDHKTNENPPRRTKNESTPQEAGTSSTPSGSGRGRSPRRKYGLAGPTTPSLDSNTRVNSWKSSKKRHAPSTSNVGSPVKKQNTNTL